MELNSRFSENPDSCQVNNFLDEIKLPKPDSRNITVLTKKLPTQPILPRLGFNLLWLRGNK